MKPSLCHAMIASLDEEEMFHDCVMWEGHALVHICLCGQTFYRIPPAVSRSTRI